VIGVKVDKNNTSKKTVQKKSTATADAKSKSAPAVAQLCGCGDKDDKSKSEKDGATAFTPSSTFWSPETIQGKFEGGIKQLKAAPSFPPIQLNDTNSNPAESISSLENKTGLPNDVKTGTEKLSGVSLNDVKVHYNSSAPAQLHAHAYAQGTDIHVGPGQEKHVPHEAWHVVQQKQGRVQATTQMKGMVPVNDDAGLEKEADVMGAKAVQMASIESEEPIQQKAISSNGVAQLGAWDWIKKTLGFGSKKEDDAKTRPRSNAFSENTPETRPRSNAVTEMPEMDEVKTRPRSNAIGNEGMMPEEDLKGLKNLRKEINEKHNILKFNFAGSGEKSWKTHKEKYQKEGLDRGTKDEKIAKREKYIKEKEATDQAANKTVVEYAGPIAKDLYVAKGLSDSGANSTEKNLEDAKLEFLKAYSRILVTPDSTIEVNIKGFSRGAATATTFAKWIKSEFGAKVKVNLVAIDPVHGSGTWEKGKGKLLGLFGNDMAKMDSSADLEGIDNSTYVFPIRSGHTWTGAAFTPQLLSNYTRIIILYGPKAKHSWGMGGKTGSTLTWNGKPIKGMKLGTLPPGLLVADSFDEDNMPIVQVTSASQWNGLKPKIVGYSKEKRDQVIDNAVEHFITTKQVVIDDKAIESTLDNLSNSQEKDNTKMTKKDIVKIGSMLGSGGMSAGVPVAKHFSDHALQFGTNLSTGLSGGIAGLGAIAGLMGGYIHGKKALEKGVDGNTKLKAGSNAVSSLAGAASSFGSLMGNVSGQAQTALSSSTEEAAKAAANQAANLSGILGIITGSIDIIKGGLEAHIAGKRKQATDNKLKEVLTHIREYNRAHGIPVKPITVSTILEQGMYDEIYNILNEYSLIAPKEGKAEEFKSLTSLASHLSRKQNNNRNSAAATIAKGAMAVAGGAVLVALGTNPIGWGLLGAAAVVGIGILINDYIKKKKSRTEVALRELDIVNEQAEWEKKHSEINGWFSWYNKKEKKKKMAEEGVKKYSPLEKKLNDLGKKDVGAWYSDYVNLTAGKIYNEHYCRDTTVSGYDTTYNNIIANLGFKTKFEIDQEYTGKDPKQYYPDKNQIAKAIAN
jgi:hypothetical protein